VSDFDVSIEDNPQQADIDYLDQSMRRFNTTFLGSFDGKPIAVFLRDQDQRKFGGAYGFTCVEWLNITNLWIEEGFRKKGYGSRILVALETQASARKCHSVIVDTYEFQALGFYQKRGYEIVCVLENNPTPYRRFYLKKKLTPLGPVIQQGISKSAGLKKHESIVDSTH
jgi:GNAT superfamily N-acetyltransferase